MSSLYGYCTLLHLRNVLPSLPSCLSRSPFRLSHSLLFDLAVFARTFIIHCSEAIDRAFPKDICLKQKKKKQQTTYSHRSLAVKVYINSSTHAYTYIFQPLNNHHCICQFLVSSRNSCGKCFSNCLNQKNCKNIRIKK